MGFETYAKPKPKTYTDHALIDALRATAPSCPSPMSPNRYAAANPGGPSHRTVTIRFGSWAAALEAAGLPTSGRKTRSDVVSPEECVQALVAFMALGTRPTARAYDAWARGRSDVPCRAIVQERYGTWAQAVAKAQAVA